MFPILAAVLALSPAPQPVPASIADLQLANPAVVEASVAPSPLPQPPRDVRVKLTSDGNVITWREPSRTASGALTGFVVIVDDQSILVDASARRAVVPATSRSMGVAAMNVSGCSLATWSPGVVRPSEPSTTPIASRLGR